MIAAFAIAAATGGTGSSPASTAPSVLPPITAAAPPNATAQTVNCTKLLEQLPVSLGALAQRVVHSPSLFVVAWGQPPVVLECGAARPKDLKPGSSAELRSGNSGVFFDLQLTKQAAIYTTVDRAPYISITFPAGRQPGDYLPTLSKVIAAALPAVCTTDPSVADLSKLCDRRP